MTNEKIKEEIQNKQKKENLHAKYHLPNFITSCEYLYKLLDAHKSTILRLYHSIDTDTEGGKILQDFFLVVLHHSEALMQKTFTKDGHYTIDISSKIDRFSKVVTGDCIICFDKDTLFGKSITNLYFYQRFLTSFYTNFKEFNIGFDPEYYYNFPISFPIYDDDRKRRIKFTYFQIIGLEPYPDKLLFGFEILGNKSTEDNK